MDFAIPRASRELASAVRKMVESQLIPIERIWREFRAIRILEGTSEIMRHITTRDIRRAKRRSN